MNNNQPTILAQGAESKILKINETTLKKVREKKTYRIPEIDEKLRKFRNRREFKVLQKLYENQINVPKPYKVIEIKNKQTKQIEEISFEFEYINGTILKQTINETLLKKAFNQIIKIHQLGITHSDLTTLNMIEKNTKIYLIDFGLADFSQKSEDRAVDLNLFFNCIKNEHPELYKHKSQLLKQYKNFDPKTIEKLQKLETRGRNKNKN